MLQVYLVRHGETQWNAERRIQGQSDSPLTAHGERQAWQVG
ncbi:histidine phosphatase family protein, partial [Klebsiella pneumoniae]